MAAPSPFIPGNFARLSHMAATTFVKMNRLPFFQFSLRAGARQQQRQLTAEGMWMRSCGVVTVVQEHRFELQGDDGTYRHFTLAHDAPLGWHELQRLARSGCRVAVQHDPPRGGHTTAAVHSISLLRAGEPVGVAAQQGG
jgi:hypothetical protein